MQSGPGKLKSRSIVMLLTFLLAFTLAVGATEPRPQSANPSSDAFSLTLGGHSFDPLDQAGEGLFADYQANPSGDFHLIQFEGPIRDHWFQGMRDQGIEVVQYIHPYTYIVWAAEPEVAAARNMNGVRWSGPFLPEFRVIPEQRELGREREPTNILVSRHADQRALRADLDSMGVEVLHSQPYLGHFTLLEARAAADRYMDLGRMAPVYTVQRAQPMAPRGEMSNQAIVDLDFTSNQNVVPGYDDWLSATGYDGSGVTVSIIDGGIRESHQDLQANMEDCVSQGSPTSCTTSNDNHGTHVAGGVAGNAASGTTDSDGFLRGQGVAPGAGLVQQRYQSGGLSYNFGSSCDDPDNYCTTPSGMLVLFKEAALSGATHANNSWGSTGIKIGYDLATQQVDVMTRDARPEEPGAQPVLPVWSIMNGGGDVSGGACPDASLGAPDEAKNLFAVGSTELIPGNYGTTTVPNPSDFFNVSANSAHGPACDGRVGVHIVAPGCGTDAPTAGSDSSYGATCGTSMASPVVSGALAVFIEYYRDQFGGATPSPALMKAAMMGVAANMHGQENADGGPISETPSRFQGYGRLDLDSAVNPDGNVMYFDQETVFDATGQDWSLPLIADDPDQPVRVMMVYTDAYGHGLGGDTPAWVNDLDLSVSVGGDTYLGNQIGPDGYSVAGGEADGRNNMEAVFLRADQHGGDAFDVTVFAANIAADAINPHDPQGPAQDFALVCYNCEFGDPTFSMGLDPDAIGACVPEGGSEEYAVNVDVGALGDYTGTVALSAAGEPAGVGTAFDPTSVAVPGSSELTLTIDGSASAGSGSITVSGDDGDDVIERELALVIDEPLLQGPALNAPGDGATDTTLEPEFEWDGLSDVVEYRIQVATDAGFSDLVHDEVVEETGFLVDDELDTGTEYFWRVTGINLCGDGEWSDVFSFTTRLEPEAGFSADAFAFVVAADEAASDALVISNTGTGNLTFDIDTDSPGAKAMGRGFEGDFHPDNWELVNDPAGVNGSVEVEDGPPAELFVTGGDDGTGGDTDFQIEIPMDGTITFDWGYQSTDSGCFDSGGYAINGAFTELACNSDDVPYFDETETVEVSAGDVFAFRVNTDDGLFGPGVLGVTNFDFAPAVCADDLASVPWLTATPSSGSVPEGDSDTVTVSVDSTGLANGDYIGYLCVSTNAENAPTVPMPVELTVEGATEPTEPVADVTPASFEFVVSEDGADSDTLFIANIGGGELTWAVDTAEPEAVGYRYDLVEGAEADIALPQGASRAAGTQAPGQAPARVAGGLQPHAIAGDFDEGFEDVDLLPGAGWVLQNNSDPLGASGWFQGNDEVFAAHDGPDDAYIAANFANVDGAGTISNWLLTPEFELHDGTEIRFWTREPAESDWADRLQVRLSTSGASDDVGSSASDVGDFTELLLEINESQTVGAYPNAWTEYTITLGDSHDGHTGRVAFRYFVEDGGASGSAGDYIGIDSFSVTQPEGPSPGSCQDPATIDWLAATPDTGSTSAGESSEVAVMVDADGLAEGEYGALLCVTTNDPDSALVEVPVSMTVLDGDLGQIAVDPATLNFGAIALGDDNTLTFTVSNVAEAGALSLELGELDLSGDSEFEITGGDCAVGTELEPGESCPVEVTFAPSDVDSFSAVVTVTTTDGAMEMVGLAGEGTELAVDIFHDRFEAQD